MATITATSAIPIIMVAMVAASIPI